MDSAESVQRRLGAIQLLAPVGYSHQEAEVDQLAQFELTAQFFENLRAGNPRLYHSAPRLFDANGSLRAHALEMFAPIGADELSRLTSEYKVQLADYKGLTSQHIGMMESRAWLESLDLDRASDAPPDQRHTHADIEAMAGWVFLGMLANGIPPYAALLYREMVLHQESWRIANPGKKMPRELELVGLEYFESLRSADIDDIRLFRGPATTFLGRNLASFERALGSSETRRALRDVSPYRTPGIAVMLSFHRGRKWSRLNEVASRGAQPKKGKPLSDGNSWLDGRHAMAGCYADVAFVDKAAYQWLQVGASRAPDLLPPGALRPFVRSGPLGHLLKILTSQESI